MITGGLAHNAGFMNRIIEYIDWIAPVSVYPGEDELFALASGAMRYLDKIEDLKEY